MHLSLHFSCVVSYFGPQVEAALFFPSSALFEGSRYHPHNFIIFVNSHLKLSAMILLHVSILLNIL